MREVGLESGVKGPTEVFSRRLNMSKGSCLLALGTEGIGRGRGGPQAREEVQGSRHGGTAILFYFYLFMYL